MSQLIALIIAIALGAIVTAIGYVFLGDAFTKNSEKGVALQFINQASQVEMAMTAYRAENARSAFVTDWNETQVDTTSGAGEEKGLVDTGYLKAGIAAPQGDYVLFQDATSNKVYLVAEHADLSDSVCQQINKVAGFGLYKDLVNTDNTVDSAFSTAATVTALTVETAINSRKFSCAQAADTDTNVFIYSVE
jgi:hypothetical protein